MPHSSVPSLRIATWNLENYGDSREHHAAKTARLAHVLVQKLNNPHILAVQEMCDDSGKTDDGVTSATRNAQDLIEAIRALGGPEYRYCEIAPENNKDGGKPGSNIRNGYFYRPDRVALTAPLNVAGSAALLADSGTEIGLCCNPCLIAADSDAFTESRKPLLAQFTDLKTQEQYFIANLHLASDGGFKRFRATNPDQAEADSYRPPAPAVPTPHQPNAERLAQRIAQAQIVNAVSDTIRTRAAELGNSTRCHTLVLGDFNTSTHVARNGVPEENPKPEVLSTLERSGLIDIAASIGASCPSQAHHDLSMTLDYIYASPELAARAGNPVRPLVNGGDFGVRASDHNPTMVSIRAPLRAVAQPLPGTLSR